MTTIHSARLLIAAAVLSMAGAAYAQDSHDLSTRYEGRGVLRELNVQQPEFYRPGEVIDFEVLGRPRGSASVSISTSRGAKLLPLTETSPGVYEGTYRVRRDDDFARPAFSATLSRRGVVGKAWASPEQTRHANVRPTHDQRAAYEQRDAYERPAHCQNCGVITDIRMVERGSRDANAPGIIIGGIVGGVLGNQVGGGSGRDVATVLGALAGGAAGNEIGKNQARDPEWLITVRLDNGSSQTFRNSQRPRVGQGQRVRVENDQLIVDDLR